MSAMSPSASFAERARYRLYGLVFVLVVVLLAALMVAQYNKAFTPVDHVTVDSDRAGLQLVPHSDVKVRGLIVGEVRSIKATRNGAAIGLAIDPDKASLIPEASSARMLPKTVFGEKYVDLVPPAGGLGGAHLKSGDVIPQDRSSTAIEVNQVLDDVMPLLTEVQPAKVNETLNALATALQGRGDELGQTLVEADGYLKKINPQLPLVMHDLRALGMVSDNVNGAAPDLLAILNNLQTTDRTIVAKEPQLVQVLDRGINLTGKVTPFLEDNEPRIVGAQIANRQALALLAQYSPSVPCVLESMAQLQPRLIDAMGGRQPGVHVTIELVKPRPGYKPGLDDPQLKDRRKPRCYGLPNNVKKPFPQYQELDGTEDDAWWSGGAGRSLSSILLRPGADDGNSTLKSLMGAAMGTSGGQLSDLAALLYQPAANGMVVNVK